MPTKKRMKVYITNHAASVLLENLETWHKPLDKNIERYFENISFNHVLTDKGRLLVANWIEFTENPRYFLKYIAKYKKEEYTHSYHKKKKCYRMHLDYLGFRRLGENESQFYPLLETKEQAEKYSRLINSDEFKALLFNREKSKILEKLNEEFPDLERKIEFDDVFHTRPNSGVALKERKEQVLEEIENQILYMIDGIFGFGMSLNDDRMLKQEKALIRKIKEFWILQNFNGDPYSLDKAVLEHLGYYECKTCKTIGF